jgi:hypothetical protein
MKKDISKDISTALMLQEMSMSKTKMSIKQSEQEVSRNITHITMQQSDKSLRDTGGFNGNGTLL